VKQSPDSDETVFVAREGILKRTPDIVVPSNWMEVAMNAIVANVLMREAAEAQAGTRPFTVMLLFCGLGLLATLCMSSLGFDVTGGAF
jgi:hypothetical protein